MLPTSPIRILIVDDHRLFNDGLRAMVSEYPQIEVVGQIYYSPDTQGAIHQHQPDIVLMDFNMPRMNGLEVAQAVLTSFPQQAILIITMYTEERYRKQFQQLGVKGYLAKTVSADEVVKAIETIQNGGVWFPAIHEPLPVNNLQSGDDFLARFNLTGRELDVLRLIRQNLPNKVIADQLNISVQTVETHRKNMCMKLHLKGPHELLRFAIEHDF